MSHRSFKPLAFSKATADTRTSKPCTAQSNKSHRMCSMYTCSHILFWPGNCGEKRLLSLADGLPLGFHFLLPFLLQFSLGENLGSPKLPSCRALPHLLVRDEMTKKQRGERYRRPTESRSRIREQESRKRGQTNVSMCTVKHLKA